MPTKKEEKKTRQVGDKRVTQTDFDTAKALKQKQTEKGTSSIDINLPKQTQSVQDIFQGEKTAEAERQQALAINPLLAAARADPTQLGLESPGSKVENPGNIEVSTQAAEKEKKDTITVNVGGELKELSIKEAVRLGVIQDERSEQFLGAERDLGLFAASATATPGALAAGAAALERAAPKVWKVGKNIFGDGTKAVQAGNAAKNGAAVKSTAATVRDFAIGGYAALKGGEGLIGYFTGRKVDEQQAAVNTLGQLATTIAGQASESAGDWKKGLNELNYIEQTILELESSIKAGTIQSGALKFNGQIYDINADITDQLATIQEQKTILQSFVLNQNFPELKELEVQSALRQLEEEGYIKPVDITSVRRNQDGQV